MPEILLVFWVRTVRLRFFRSDLCPRALRAWAINPRGNNSVRNLQYGPRTRLVRGIHTSDVYITQKCLQSGVGYCFSFINIFLSKILQYRI